METSPNRYVYKTLTPKSGNIEEEAAERKQEQEYQRLCCQIASPSNIRSYTHEVSLTCTLKDDTNGHAKLDIEL